MDFGKRIKDRRLELGMTLEEVAKIVGVAKATVQRWETGDIQNMRRDKLDPLAKALKTSTAYLQGYIDDPDKEISFQTIRIQNADGTIELLRTTGYPTEAVYDLFVSESAQILLDAVKDLCMVPLEKPDTGERIMIYHIGCVQVVADYIKDNEKYLKPMIAEVLRKTKTPAPGEAEGGTEDK